MPPHRRLFSGIKMNYFTKQERGSLRVVSSGWVPVSQRARIQTARSSNFQSLTWRFHERVVFRANSKRSSWVIRQTCVVKTVQWDLLRAMRSMIRRWKMFGGKSTHSNLRIVVMYWQTQSTSITFEPQKLSRHMKVVSLAKIYAPGSKLDCKTNEKVQALKTLRILSLLEVLLKKTTSTIWVTY